MDDILEKQRHWITLFDRCVEDGQWDRLHDYVTDDVRYIVSGSPFHCSLKGKDTVIDGLAKSIAGFDRKFDSRVWKQVGTRVLGPNCVTANVWSEYALAGRPLLAFPVVCHWYFRDGKIELMTDYYDESFVELQEAYAWLSQGYGEFDASYA